MTHQPHIQPSWSQLARDWIERLRLHHAGRAHQLATKDKKSGHNPETDEDLDSLAEAFDRFRGDDVTPDEPFPLPWAAVPARETLMIIRLAAAFGSQGAHNAAQESGAITILSGIQLDDYALIAETLSHCWPTASWVTLQPSISDGAISKSSEARFRRGIDERLDRIVPSLILMPDGMDLPDHLRHAGLPSYAIPPISSDIMIELLRAGSLSDQLVDEATFRRGLPDDAALSRLDTAHVCVALRTSDLAEVSGRIAAMVAPLHARGPRLEDMAGDSPALLAARRLVIDLLGWRRGEVAWSELSRSILFYGPPGTGKTWIARAMGNSAGIACVTGSFAEWQSAGHLGDMLREMRKTFSEARRMAPCILFIDEIDAIGSRADGDRHGQNYRTQVINGFLGEMNSISSDEGVIVIGACNHPDKMDPAVVRAGRFDLKIEVPLPDADSILALLRQQLREYIADIDLRSIARLAVGRSPAELDAAIRACRSDARHQRKLVSAAMLRSQLRLNPADDHPGLLRRVAVHEAGHAIVGAALGLGRIERMMITEGGGEIHRSGMSSESLLSDIENEICYDLGGRAAEQLVTGIASAGAGGPEQSDLARATTRALYLESVYGLGLEGPVWHHNPGALMMQDSLLRARVRQRIERQERRASEILAQHRATLEALAQDLAQRRSLNSTEIAAHLRAMTHPSGPHAVDTVAQIDAMLEAMASEI